MPLALLGVSFLDWPAGLNPAQALFRKGLDMGKTIEIRLSDAQYAALSEAATASGHTAFFSFCRDRLMEGLTEPKPVLLRVPPQLSGGRSTSVQVAAVDAPAKVAEFAERLAALPAGAPAPADDRIARIEDAVARLTDYVMGHAAPAEQPHEPEPNTPIDVDSLVDAQFRDAEANGLTEHIPDADEEVMQHAGVRPLSRRPQRYSANSGPRHLQELLG